MNEEDKFEPLPDEEAPDSLQEKWKREEFHEEREGKRFIVCTSCQKLIEQHSFFCVYCGTRVFKKSGLLGLISETLRSGKLWVLIVFVLLSVWFLTSF